MTAAALAWLAVSPLFATAMNDRVALTWRGDQLSS